MGVVIIHGVKTNQKIILNLVMLLVVIALHWVSTKLVKEDIVIGGVKIKYTLYGLDSTNSNAFKRLIILHSWELVPDEEIYPDGTPEGWGCPAISNKNFMIIDSMLKNSPKPVLMWIYK